MTQREHILTIAHILDALLEDAILPYSSLGANVGRCRHCGAIGVVRYPNVVYKHADACPVQMLEQLHQSLEKENHI